MGRRRKPVSIPDPHPGTWSTSWFFQYTEKLWEKYILPLKGQVHSYLEIGCAEGRSMLWILENLNPELCVGVDAYAPDKRDHETEYARFEANMRANLAPWLATGQCVVHKAKSQDFLRERHNEIPDDSVDLAYLDGAHDAWLLMTDISLVWPKLKRQGGIMVLDDTQKIYHLRPLTRMAWWGFQFCYDNRYDLFFKEGRQVAVVRTR